MDPIPGRGGPPQGLHTPSHDTQPCPGTYGEVCKGAHACYTFVERVPSNQILHPPSSHPQVAETLADLLRAYPPLFRHWQAEYHTLSSTGASFTDFAAASRSALVHWERSPATQPPGRQLNDTVKSFIKTNSASLRSKQVYV